MTNPIRVLQIVTQMNRAGLENRLMEIYQNIDRNQVQFDFYTCREVEGYYDPEIKAMGGKIYYSAPLSIMQSPFIPMRFKSFFNKHPEYSIVHCHLNQWCGLILKGAKQAGIPIRIAHSRTAIEKKNIKNILKNIVKLPVNHYATHCFAVSQKAGEWLFGEKAVKSGNIHIWPNSIDCKKYIFKPDVRKQMRKELGLGSELTIIHVGNLRFEKNHLFLLRIFKSILKRVPSAKLILVGKDCLNGYIQNCAKDLGVFSSVLFLGSRSDVAKLLHVGDVFVFPSIYEGFPGAVLEAQASGLPCVISDTITNEICVTPLVKQLSLKLSTVEWANEILKRQNFKRENMYEILKIKGYDIQSLADKMTNFYKSFY